MVFIYVSVTPNVPFDCPDNITLNENDDFSCSCRHEMGNPPANVSWYKDDKKFRETGQGGRLLILKKVDDTDSGTYKCRTQGMKSHYHEMDEKSITVIVRCKYH